ncbi:MAG: hypothetical protein IKN43_03060 [Selenomonadaceae bacterium]|nr:hypothetical protein [Selenomonadaceae bacterium]
MQITSEYMKRVSELGFEFFTLNNPPCYNDPQYAEARNAFNDLVGDEKLIERIIKFYKRTIGAYNRDKSDMWSGFFDEKKKMVNDALMEGDAHKLKNILRNPAENNLFLGFDSTSLWEMQYIKDENQRRMWIFSLYDKLISLAVIIGCIRCPNPENQNIQEYPYDPDELLDKISDYMQFDINFPNPYAMEAGIQTKRGLMTHRAVMALYQAYKVKLLLNGISQRTRVLEIGGGSR